MKNNNITVYLIEYQGKVMYVGKTCDFKRRVYEHKHYIGTNDSAIPADVDLNDVTFKPIETFDNETDALLREDELIQEYDTINTGWNRNRSGLITIDENTGTQTHEAYLRYKKQYNDSHKEQAKQYYQRNRDVIISKQIEYYKTHPLTPEQKEKQREYHKKWHRENYVRKHA